MMKGLPNLLTYSRIVCIPLFVVFFYLPWEWARFVTAGIFAFAGMTDWLDGYLARTLSQTSALGAFLDPVADKLIVVSALILLVSEANFLFLAIASVVIAGREIVISALREWMSEVGKRSSVAVSCLGKIKTILQFLAILLLLLGRPNEFNAYPMIGILGYVLLFTAAIMTLWSMVVYLIAAKKVLTNL
jgi:CDP-diacylglycerol---glycerol-3-phosphate 3-phosphatidyltransferase